METTSLSHLKNLKLESKKISNVHQPQTTNFKQECNRVKEVGEEGRCRRRRKMKKIGEEEEEE